MINLCGCYDAMIYNKSNIHTILLCYYSGEHTQKCNCLQALLYLVMYQQFCLLSFKTSYWFYSLFNQVDGETRNLPILLDSGRVSVYSSAQYIFVSTDFGLSVGYSGSWAVNIIVPADYSGVTCGICGNFNGQNNDDFMTPSGALVRSADQFGASWKVEEELPCNDGCGNNCPLCQDQTTSRSLCDIIRSSEGPFSFCHVYVDPHAYFEDCVFDVCLSGNRNDVLCHSIQTYASACQTSNAVIYPWRESTSCGE